MKKINFIISLFFALILSIGQVWANTGQATLTYSDLSISNQTSVAGTAYPVGSYFEVTCTKNSASTNPTYYDSGTAVRCYVTKNTSNGNIIAITQSTAGAAAKAYITKVTYNGTHNKKGKTSFTYSGSPSSSDATSATYSADSKLTSASATLCETGNSANGQFYLTSVTVEYVYTPSETPTCETPTFNPEDGETFDESIEVTISAESGATIHYTTDGTTPTTSSSVYSSALTFTETTTLKAIAVKTGSNNSAVASATYTKVVSIPGYSIDFENDLDAYKDWEFSNLTKTNESITGHGSSTYFAKTNGTTTASATTKTKIDKPGVLTFYISKIGTNTNASSYWQARVSSDKSTWTVVGNNAAASGVTAGTWNTCTADLSNYSNVYVQVYYTGTTAVRTLDDIILEMASAVAKPTISGDESFLISTEVTLECTTDGADIYYTTDESKKTNPSTSTWTAYDCNNKPSFDATTTIWVAATDGTNWSSIATSTFEKIATWTVAEANYELGTSSPQNSKYVKGIISQIDNFSSPYITYWISDDGTTTDQLEVFKGKNLDNTNFSAISDLAIGDKVIVYGNLTIYKSTKEFAQDNYIVWKEAPTVATPTFTPNGGGFIVSADVTIECATANSSIYYTTNGGIPSKTTTLYESPIHITENTTIKAIAYVGDDKSIIVTKQFTLTEPMTVADAYDALTSDGMTNVGVHGIVYQVDEIASNNATYWISDDGEEGAKVLEVYRGKGLNGADVTTGDIRVGDDVIVFGNLKIYNSTKEFDTGSKILSLTRKIVTGVAVSGTPDKDSYKTGESFDPTGLTVTVTYSDASSSTVDVADCSWAIDPETFDEAGEGISVSVKAKYDDVQSSAFEVTGLTVTEAITFNNASYEWQLVTSSDQLVAGKYYVIGHAAKSAVANNTLSGGYLAKSAITLTDGAIAYNGFATSPTTKTADEAGVAVFQLGGSTGAWTLTEVLGSETGLLGGAGSTSFAWGTGTTTWPIAIDEDAKATIGDGSAERVLYNNSSPRFKPYGSSTAISATMLLPQLFVWAEKTYKLRYDANGGSNAPAATPSVSGKAIVTDALPTAPNGKVFDGWNTNEAGTGISYSAGDEVSVSGEDVTIYAQWRDPQTFQISYDANGGVLIEGKSALDPENVTEGVPYTVKANVYEKEGKIFIGWKVGDETYYDGDEILPTENMTFVAQWSDPNITDFVLVTDVKQLKDGNKVYIVAVDYNVAMGAQGNNIRNSVDIAKLNNHIVTQNVEPVELTLHKDGDAYLFQATDGYLYAAGTATSGKNYINTKATSDNDCKWTITIDAEGNAEVKSVNNTYTPYLRYNSSQPRFTCYSSSTSQRSVSFYKRPDYDRAITAGRYGTICLPKAGKIYGAVLFEIACYKSESQKIYFDEILDGTMEAGMPYLFLPEEGSSKLGVYYSDVTAADAVAQNHNGLYGSYTQSLIEQDADNYILYSNQYYLVNSEAYVGENRAYIKLTEVPGVAAAPAPGRRRVAMSVNGKQVATSIIDAEVTDQPMKVIMDNKLYIIRSGKMYDVTGNIVK